MPNNNNNNNYILAAVAIISIIFAMGTSHFEQFFNHLVFIAQADNTLGKAEIIKQPQVTYTHQPIKQHSNQHSQGSRSSQMVTQSLAGTPKEQCHRPEKLNITDQYFQLKTNYRNKPNEFTLELKQKLQATFEHIETSLNIRFNKTVSLAMFFKMTREDYENFVLKKGRSPYGNQGMFLYPENISIVEVKNYQQGIKTSIHEAVHALNYAYWGPSLRFFNEGMAEYYKEISVNGEIPPFDFTWLQHMYLPEQISTILSLDTDWHGDRTIELYQLSKAFFYFLMSHDNGKKVVWEIFKREKEDPCNVLSNDNILEVLREFFPNHEQEFDYWFRDGLDNFLSLKV